MILIFAFKRTGAFQIATYDKVEVRKVIDNASRDYWDNRGIWGDLRDQGARIVAHG